MGPRIIIKASGDAIGRTGYDEDLSEVFAHCLPHPRVASHPKVLQVLREYGNFELDAGEHDDVLTDEPFEKAMERVDGYLASKGAILKPMLKEHYGPEDRKVSVKKGKSTVTIEFIISILRRLYRKLGELGLRSKANPTEVIDWHLKSKVEHYLLWHARHPNVDEGFEHAGLRFTIEARTTYPPLLYDPTNVGWRMTKALVDALAPETIIDCGRVLEENGCRWREANYLNALGWALEGFGEKARTSNKHDKDAFAKTITLPPTVLTNSIRRKEAAPHPDHPGNPKRNRMQWLRERWAAGDHEVLREEALLPSTRGGFWSPSGFNHHFKRAMVNFVNEDGSKGLLIHSDIGSRQPTSQWYRHATISIEMERIYQTAKDNAEIVAATNAMLKCMSLKSDQTTRYASRIKKRRSEYMRHLGVEVRRVESLKAREAVALAPGTLRALTSPAQAQIAAFPSRS